MLLKSDITEEAFSLLRISGLTVQAGPAETKLALGRLESLVAEMEERNIGLEYNFTEKPDINDSSGIELKYKFAISAILARRMFSDFGKGEKPDPTLVTDSNAAVSFLHASTAVVRPTQPPSRQPTGSGTDLRYNRFNTFFQPIPVAPNETATKSMTVGNIDNFTESFSAYLKSEEDISSYTLTASEGLTITVQGISASLQEIDYTVRADGNSEISSDSFLVVQITVTTSNGRIETHFINFILKSVEL